MSLSNFELSRLFFALVLLLASAHVLGYFFHRLGLPRVVGEISGGLLLGPTLLGHFSPGAYKWLFTAFESEGKLISLTYWLGLVLLMFISGFEIEKDIDKRDKRMIVWILLGSTIIPFAAGWLAPAVFDFSSCLGEKDNPLALKIVIATAAAVTSIPVISKIFLDLNIMNTRFAKIVLTTATLHDIALWVALSMAVGLVSAKALSGFGIFTTVLVTVLFFLFMLFVMPRAMRLGNNSRFNYILKSSPGGYVLFMCFLFAAVASILDVNVIFGVFMAGIVIGLTKDEKLERQKQHIKEVAFAFFIPIYFAIVGLKLDLIHHFNVLFFLGFMAFCMLFQAIGTFISARLGGADNKACLNFSMAMNARGGPGIVLATVAFETGIINQDFFVTLVMLAIVTSLIAGWWFRRALSKGWQPGESSPPPHTTRFEARDIGGKGLREG